MQSLGLSATSIIDLQMKATAIKILVEYDFMRLEADVMLRFLEESKLLKHIKPNQDKDEISSIDILKRVKTLLMQRLKEISGPTDKDQEKTRLRGFIVAVSTAIIDMTSPAVIEEDMMRDSLATVEVVYDTSREHDLDELD